MKTKNPIIIFFLIVLLIISFSTSSFADLNNYLYKGNRKSWYILEDDYSDSGTLYDKLHEDIEDNLIGDNREPDVVKTKSGMFVDDNVYYFYSWLHGAHDMVVDYILETDFKDISSENDNDALKAGIGVLKYTKGALGSFVVETDSLPDPDSFFFDDDSTWKEFARSATAYATIAGTGKKYQEPEDGKVVDAFEKQVDEAIRAVQAAYDYKNDSTEYSSQDVYIGDDFDTKANYDYAKIRSYLNSYGERYNVGDKNEELKEIWEKTIGMTTEEAIENYDDLSTTGDVDAENARKLAEKNKETDSDLNKIFKLPTRIAGGKTGINDAVDDAEKFVTATNDTKEVFNEADLSDFSNNIYNMLLTVGIIVAVIVGVILGVKLMLAPVAERAEAKKLLMPYAIGCVIIFGAFGVWRIAVIILQNV